MKLDESGKGAENGSEGDYSESDLEEMLETFVAAKQIEADPRKLALLRNYAKTKQQAVMDLFDVNRQPPPKSLKDLKKIADQKAREED